MNPTKEEIAEWLREAAVGAEMLYAITKNPEDDRMNLFFKRAAMVEASTGGRCGSCAYYEEPYFDSYSFMTIPSKCMLPRKGRITNQGPDFWCKFWEAKP